MTNEEIEKRFLLEYQIGLFRGSDVTTFSFRDKELGEKFLKLLLNCGITMYPRLFQIDKNSGVFYLYDSGVVDLFAYQEGCNYNPIPEYVKGYDIADD